MTVGGVGGWACCVRVRVLMVCKFVRVCVFCRIEYPMKTQDLLIVDITRVGSRIGETLLENVVVPSIAYTLGR